MKHKIFNFWCIPLYLIVLSLYISIICLTKNKKNIENYRYVGKDFKYTVKNVREIVENFISSIFIIVGISSVFYFVYSIIFLLFIMKPEIYFYFGSFVISIINIIMYIYVSFCEGKFLGTTNVLFFTFTVVGIVIISLYLFFYRVYIKYINELIKLSIQIQKSFLFLFIFIFISIIKSILTLGIIIGFKLVYLKNEIIFQLMLGFAIFICLWSILILKYLEEIFISSLLSYKILSENISIYTNIRLSLLNTMKSMGTVLAGTLYVVLFVFFINVYLLYFFLVFFKVNPLNYIFEPLLHSSFWFLFDITLDIIYNCLIYVAIYGCSLNQMNSDKKLRISDLRCSALFSSSMFGIMNSINLINIAIVIICIYSNFLTNPNPYINKLHRDYIQVPFNIGVYTGIAFGFALFSTISTGYRTILVLHEVKREYLEEKMPILERIRVQMVIFN